ncbi:DUF427 domain-containing protein [Nocardioides sp. YIM 152315]|uniref:DUF427 domain-containing protein n=1 Tax=Nocardioides sp. YIM 152315 TaxID=3031760 RepID=UPI0023DBA22A|nr:DUF427 domain-containing protein [Nocardioides sp. YIM 152315]MDF1604089.1 DUF427 domain-containing protein [Nocardioides sp. YIM 152315]
MQAWIGETVVAEADEEQLVRIEGHLYFPPDAVRWSLFDDSATPYTCPWKGAARYWTVTTRAGVHTDAAWGYPSPLSTAIDHVGFDFSGYVAFDPIQVVLLESRRDTGLV